MLTEKRGNSHLSELSSVRSNPSLLPPHPPLGVGKCTRKEEAEQFTDAISTVFRSAVVGRVLLQFDIGGIIRLGEERKVWRRAVQPWFIGMGVGRN
jgi:hypothetical protein